MGGKEQDAKVVIMGVPPDALLQEYALFMALRGGS
jgi:hypothetical protein